MLFNRLPARARAKDEYEIPVVRLFKKKKSHRSGFLVKSLEFYISFKPYGGLCPLPEAMHV